jgi:hypothetical protein
MRPFAHFVSLVLMLLVQPVIAQPNTQMKLKIEAFPHDAVKSIVIGGDGDAGERELTLDVQGLTSVEVGETAWMRSTVTVRWNDDTSTSHPVHISVIFAGRPEPIYLYFRKDETQSVVAPGATLKCVDSPPTLVPELLRMQHECRRLTKKIEETAKYTLFHKRTLTGWFEASSSLYRKSTPVGPYGVDPELLTRAREIVRMVDERRYAESAFQPFRVADARDLIKLVDDEDIHLAPYVTKLTELARWEDAKRLNDFITARFDELSRERDVPVIRGVNKNLLQENDKYIELKRKR